MATLGNTYINLIDIMKGTTDGKQAAKIIEMLMLSQGILDDAMVVPCNDGTNHKHAIRTGLPENAWGALYKGVKQSKSSKQQVTDVTGFLEASSAVDTRMGDVVTDGLLNGIRLQEIAAHMESMMNEMATGLFYHDTATAPEKFKGLGARLNKIGGSAAGNQIVDAGGTGADNSSIWFVTWGLDTCHLLYPSSTKGGIQRTDHGKQRTLDSSNNPYYIYEEMLCWHMGLALKDYRFVSRVANIDTSAMLANPSDIDGNGNDLYHFLRKAYYKLQNRRITRVGNNIKADMAGKRQIAMYCNTDVLEALDALGSNSGNSDNFTRLRPMEIEGKEVDTYRRIPIRETDALLNTEARVT